MVTKENVLHIPEVPLMIPGHLLMTIALAIATIMILKGLGQMKVDAGFIILHVLLLPPLLRGLLVMVVAMMPIICLVAAVGSLDSSCLGG